MVRENNRVSELDLPQGRIEALIDILNGLHPRRARNWNDMLDTANLAHMMTYGTAEGMCAWMEWVFRHRKDSSSLSADQLMNIWRYCGTNTAGQGSCPMDTLLMIKKFGEASALTTPTGSGHNTSAGTVTQQVVAFNALYGLLRMDNPQEVGLRCFFGGANLPGVLRSLRVDNL
jgi:hypothetical protein